MIIAVVIVTLLAGLLVATHFSREFGVKRWAVHAARADKNIEGPLCMPWSTLGIIHDEHGKPVSPVGKFVGCVAGESMTPYGMKKGQTFFADLVNNLGPKDLKSGDLVVVVGPAKASNTGRRLRCVDRVEGREVLFKPGTDGRVHRTRPLSSVKAKVTHILAA